MNLFGKKKAAATSSSASNGPRLDDAINALRSTQQMLDKRREHLDSEIEATKRQAKLKLQAKDKRGALSMLKRAKGMEVQRDQLYGKVENLDTQILTLQAAIGNQEVFSAMRQGHEALKLATKMTNADNVADMMEDIAEGIADVEEVNNAMAQSLGPPLDEDELTQELDAMEQEMMEEQLLAAPDLAGPRNVSSKSTVTSAAVPAVVAAPSPAVVAPTAVSSSSSQSQIDLIAQSLPTVPSSSNRASAATVTVPQPALSDRESQELRELEAAMQM